MRYRSVDVGVQSIGPREFEGIAATSNLQDDGIALDMGGADLSRFAGGGPLCVSHDLTRQVGRVTSLRATTTNLVFRATFPEAGASRDADEACALVKQGIWTGVSLGFGIMASEPITKGRPADGIRATKWIVYEISLAAVPVDIGAVITTRSLRMQAGADADWRRRLAAVAELSEGNPLSFTSRQAVLAGLDPTARARAVAELTPCEPVFDGDAAKFARDMLDHLVEQSLSAARMRFPY